MEIEELRSVVLDMLNKNIDYPLNSFKVITDVVIGTIIEKNIISKPYSHDNQNRNDILKIKLLRVYRFARTHFLLKMFNKSIPIIIHDP